MAQKQKKKQSSNAAASGSTSATALIAVAAGLAAFFWWKRRQNKDTSGEKGARSAFKFPAGKATVGSNPPSNLPRHKTSNNKKNKTRKKEERQKRAEKNDKTASVASGSVPSGGDQGQSSTAVVNYSYFDTARRDTVIPIHKKPSLSAADVMKP